MTLILPEGKPKTGHLLDAKGEEMRRFERWETTNARLCHLDDDGYLIPGECVEVPITEIVVWR